VFAGRSGRSDPCPCARAQGWVTSGSEDRVEKALEGRTPRRAPAVVREETRVRRVRNAQGEQGCEAGESRGTGRSTPPAIRGVREAVIRSIAVERALRYSGGYRPPRVERAGVGETRVDEVVGARSGTREDDCKAAGAARRAPCDPCAVKL
jgi:hypothetical protein